MGAGETKRRTSYLRTLGGAPELPVCHKPVNRRMGRAYFTVRSRVKAQKWRREKAIKSMLLIKYHLREALNALTASVWLSLDMSLFWMQMEGVRRTRKMVCMLSGSRCQRPPQTPAAFTLLITFQTGHTCVSINEGGERGWAGVSETALEMHADSRGTCDHAQAKPLVHSLFNWVSKEKRGKKRKITGSLHVLPACLSGHDVYWSDKTCCLQKGIKDKLFCLSWRPGYAQRIVGNTLGSVEGLVRNGILKASLSIMYTLLNNIADYVVDQTFKGK